MRQLTRVENIFYGKKMHGAIKNQSQRTTHSSQSHVTAKQDKTVLTNKEHFQLRFMQQKVKSDAYINISSLIRRQTRQLE